MDAQLLELLHSCTLGGNIIGASYQALYGAKSRYNVTGSKLADFLSGYCHLAYDDEKQEDSEDYKSGSGLCVGEIVEGRDTLPVMGHFNLRFHLRGSNVEEANLFGEDLLMAIASCYQEAIRQLLDLSSKMSELICCVQEGHQTCSGETTSIQVNFHFPYCQVNIGFQRQVLRPLVEQLLRQRKIVDRFETQPIGDWKEIIQELGSAVPLYRSISEANSSPMTLSHVYQYIEESNIDNGIGPELKLEDVFTPGNHSYIFHNKCSGNFLEQSNDVRYWLPLFLSIYYWPGQTQPKESVHRNSGTPSREYEEHYDAEAPIEIARHLLPLLSAERANKEYYWLDIGRVLYNITDGGEEGLNLWLQFGTRSTNANYDRNMYAHRYYNLRGSPLTVKTIAWYAQSDNRVAYDEWHRAWCQQSLTGALSCTHADVAKAVYRVSWLEYMCTSMEKNRWYKFVGTLLKPLDDAVSLRQDINNKFIPVYEEMRADASRRIFTELQGRDAEKKQLELLITQITGLIKKLKSESYKSTLIKACREFFYVENFGQIVDNDPDKTGWINCVVEICNGNAYHRPGKPEDFITMCTNIPLRIELTFNHPLVIELMNWLRKVFVDKELLHYFCKDVASFLKGRNAEKHFRVWTGDTDNSKSMIVKLCQATLGMYIFDLPVSVFSGKTFSSSGPNPELAQARGCHVGIATEPDADDEFRSGPIKRQTGGDRFFARNCNENGGSIQAFHKTILMCNRIPNIANADKAVMNRFLILPFLSTWVDNPPATEEEQYDKRLFQKDPFFERRIPDLAHAFGWLMIQYYPAYEQEGLKPPIVVSKYIDHHWEDRDPYLAFIVDRIAYAYKDSAKKIYDTDATLTASEIYGTFKQWFRDQYPGAPIPTSTRFKEEMCDNKRLGIQGGNRRWLGIRLNLPVPTNLAMAGI
jgi:phage/plasmid-associated DNA primase